MTSSEVSYIDLSFRVRAAVTATGTRNDKSKASGFWLFPQLDGFSRDGYNPMSAFR
jgi:hypothetical protein